MSYADAPTPRSGDDPPETLADLLASWPGGGGALRVDCGLLLAEAVSRLDAAGDSPGLLVCRGEDGPVVAAVPRSEIAATVSRLLADRGDPQRTLNDFVGEWQKPMLRLDAATTLSCAVKLAIARPAAQRYEPVLIDSGEHGPAMLDLRALLLAQCTALEQTALQAETSRAATEQRAAARTRFLVAMGHEIRTPMTAILGFTELLADDSLRPHERALHGDAIRRNADHLLQMLNDLLDASKLESGKMTIEARACDPLASIDDAIAIMRHSAEHKGLSLERTAAGVNPPCITADPLRLRQILLNLLSNAIKFTDRGGIRIELVAVPGPAPALAIHVRDTGSGMTPEQCREVFEAFNQADPTIARRFGGTGLGLSISRQLAELMGGSLTCTSTPGHGSTFTLFLKANLAVTTNAQADAFPAPTTTTTDARPLAGIRVLVAEDSIDNERLICTQLTRAGASVLAVRDGSAAVKAILHPSSGSEPIDVILMDVEMPVMDGLVATKLLRARRHTLPILAMTAHDAGSHRQLCLEAGCNDQLVKPIRRDQLLQSISQWAAKHRSGRTGRAAA
jgi:signal transduction histidine kinase